MFLAMQAPIDLSQILTTLMAFPVLYQSILQEYGRKVLLLLHFCFV